eukprot:2284072-Lingulodinium_polyedra.AAC.1
MGWSSALWHWLALPGQWALLTSGTPELVAKGLLHTRKVWEVWEEAKGRKEPLVVKWCSRSYLAWAFVAEVCQELASTGFTEVPPGLRQKL